MSRSRHSSKGPGYDFWSKRPPNTGMQGHGRKAKTHTHRLERREADRHMKQIMDGHFCPECGASCDCEFGNAGDACDHICA